MENQIFRKKSLENLSSPEQLNDYLQVTGPGIWLVLVGVILLLAGMIVWSHFMTVESYVTGTARAESGVLTIEFEDDRAGQEVKKGMEVHVGEIHTRIQSVGQNEKGKTIAVAQAQIPDGVYEAKVGYRSTQMIQFLFD